MLYKIRDYSSKTVLRSLYYILFHSHLSYGIPVWGNADKQYIDEIAKLPKKSYSRYQTSMLIANRYSKN